MVHSAARRHNRLSPSMEMEEYIVSKKINRNLLPINIKYPPTMVNVKIFLYFTGVNETIEFLFSEEKVELSI